jgi:hypothetical protein
MDALAKQKLVVRLCEEWRKKHKTTAASDPRFPAYLKEQLAQAGAADDMRTDIEACEKRLSLLAAQSSTLSAERAACRDPKLAEEYAERTLENMRAYMAEATYLTALRTLAPEPEASVPKPRWRPPRFDLRAGGIAKPWGNGHASAVSRQRRI